MINKAYQFANNAHKGQFRKYTGEPYITHPAEVATIVSKVTACPDTIAAAYLHDVIEDCGVTGDELKQVGFSDKTVALVVQLSDVSKPEDGNRALRKKLDREAYINATPEAQTIKLADMISNAISIVAFDPSFAKVYVKECQLLLPYLSEGSDELKKVYSSLIHEYHKP